MKVTIYPVNDRVPREAWAPATGLEPTLEYLYATIGCDMVECIHLPGGDLWVDEGAVEKSAGLNLGATELCVEQGAQRWLVAGTAVFVPREAEEGQ